MLAEGTTRKWTRSAIECYKLGCVCVDCPIYSILKDRCRMKKTVLKLVEKHGKPDIDSLDFLLDEEESEE